MLVAWLIFPLVLAVLCAGCGLLVEAACARRLPTTLLPAVGFAVLIAVGQFLTLTDATAELTVPAAVVLAIVGIVLGSRSRGLMRGAAIVPALAALGVFAVFAAPMVLSGEATIAGYIELDDTATWLALTDRVMEHGRDLDGLQPSTYEATLAFNLGDGYPVGAFVPFGVAGALVGVDLAWLIQPYIAFLAVLLSLALWSLAKPLAGSPALRGAAAFVGAQPALLFGYYLWGGIKEVAAAALVAAIAAALAELVGRRGDPRLLAVPAILSGALVGVLSIGAGLWLAPLLAAAALLLGREIGLRASVVRARPSSSPALAVLDPAVAALGFAVAADIVAAHRRRALREIWSAPWIRRRLPASGPQETFGCAPVDELVTYGLIVIACTAAVGGLAWCLRRRQHRPGALRRGRARRLCRARPGRLAVGRGQGLCHRVAGNSVRGDARRRRPRGFAATHRRRRPGLGHRWRSRLVERACLPRRQARAPRRSSRSLPRSASWSPARVRA